MARRPRPGSIIGLATAGKADAVPCQCIGRRIEWVAARNVVRAHAYGSHIEGVALPGPQRLGAREPAAAITDLPALGVPSRDDALRTERDLDRVGALVADLFGGLELRMRADAHALIDGVAVTERLFAGGGVTLLGSPPRRAVRVRGRAPGRTLAARAAGRPGRGAGRQLGMADGGVGRAHAAAFTGAPEGDVRVAAVLLVGGLEESGDFSIAGVPVGRLGRGHLGKQAQENQKDDSAGLDFHVRFLDVVRWEQRPIDL